MKFKLFLCVLIMGFNMVNASEWNVNKEISPIDDSLTVRLNIKSDIDGSDDDIKSLSVICRDGYGIVDIHWLGYPQFKDGEIIPIIYRNGTHPAVYMDIKVNVEPRYNMTSLSLPYQNVIDFFHYSNPGGKFYFQTNVNGVINKKLSITYENINDPEIRRVCGF